MGLRQEVVLVQKRREFGLLTNGCVRFRKEAVLVLLGTQYGSQFGSKTVDCFGPKEGGTWIHDKRLFLYKAADSVGPSPSVTELTKQTPPFLPGISYVIAGYPRHNVVT